MPETIFVLGKERTAYPDGDSVRVEELIRRLHIAPIHKHGVEVYVVNANELDEFIEITRKAVKLLNGR